MIIDEYLKYRDEYRNKYGESTLILMQIGSFYEAYSIIENCPYLYKIGDICNMQISRKNKSIKEISKNNPLMAGFPTHALDKFLQILLQHNYTIVKIDQPHNLPIQKERLPILSVLRRILISLLRKVIIFLFFILRRFQDY